MDECWNKVPHLFIIKLNWHSDSTLIIPSTCLIVNLKNGKLAESTVLFHLSQ